MRSIIGFLIVFSIIVIVHELGHFVWARRAGILVREFSVGMGPKLFSTQDATGTTYTLRMLPMGGYVRLAGAGEDDESIQAGMEVGLILDDQGVVTQINASQDHQVEELPLRVDQVDLTQAMTIQGFVTHQAERQTFQVDRQATIREQAGTLVTVAPAEVTYEAASPWNKFKMNVAGPVHNFILSIVAFTIIGFSMPGIPSGDNTLGEIREGESAYQAGLQSGDVVEAIDGNAITDWEEMVTYVQKHPGEELVFTVQRGEETLEKPVEIAAVKDQNTQEEYGQMGVYSSLDTSVKARILYGFTETWAVITAIVTTLAGMFKKGFDLNSFGGPVAMAQMTGQAVNSGFTTTLWLMGMLSANLGALNLLPLPALDGGKIVLNGLEAVRGKPLSESAEGLINILGFVFLIGFMLLVTWNDISRLFQ